MTQITGKLRKLSGQLSNPIEYTLPLDDHRLEINSLLGKQISLEFLEAIFCIQCNRKTSKSFQQGYCYPCYRKLLDCNLCMLHPERCNYPHQQCPDTWEHAHCKQEHIVYLANSSGLKVGITRATQVPTRWIDQGAVQAISLFKVNNRYQSGQIEVFYKQHVADKTHWRKMLQGDNEHLNMLQIKQDLLRNTEQEISQLCCQQEVVTLAEDCVTLTYPIMEIPKKLIALSLDKTKKITGTLLGIKGQYLMFDTGVLNIRKHGGYQMAVTF